MTCSSGYRAADRACGSRAANTTTPNTRNYCGPAICDTHDGTPTTAHEDQQYEDGYDPCIHILRLYPDAATKTAVETNHPPSIWRQP